MIRRVVLGILVILLPAARSFGQEYFAPVGQYYAQAVGEFQLLPLVSEARALPGQYVAPGVPHGGSHPDQYPSTGSVPYTGTEGTTYPAPWGAPRAAGELTSPLPSYQPSNEALEPAPASSPTAEESEAASVAEGKSTEGFDGEAEKTLEEPIAIEEDGPKAWYYAPVLWFDLWEGNVEFGLSGSEGNSQTLNYLLGLEAKRETKENIFDFSMNYDRKSADSIETAHRLFAEGRWELLFEDSAWTWFFHETTEYDEFKAFDMRLSYDTGLGRCLIKNDDTSLLARAGGGVSHEIGGPADDPVPEAVFGLEFKHKLNERQKLSASSEYSPDVTDFLDYRLKSKAAWEVLLDEATNLSLKVSVLDRYDSTPNGKKHNDFDYTLTLLWNF